VRTEGGSGYVERASNRDPSRCQRPRGANAPSWADSLDRRVPVDNPHHTVCKIDRISPAIHAREVFATSRGQGATVVVETTDSRVEEGHSEVDMDIVCASASSFAGSARG